MTREEILKIDAYCQEHEVSYRQRLKELGIPFWDFYKAKKKYRLQDEAVVTAESYLTVELRTPNGTAMSIQGSMTAAVSSWQEGGDVPGAAVICREQGCEGLAGREPQPAKPALHSNSRNCWV